jgi:aminoglycoside phosphotransferase (APT) family kinase protein
MRGIDEAKVSRWLAENVDGAAAPFTFEFIAGGRSNLTFKVTGADGHRYVVRRPPLGKVLATAHDMAREHRIVSAIGTTSVPVAQTLGVCTDETVNGAPFYVMAFVDGAVLDSVDKADALPIALRRPASEHLVDVLADLHAVDVDAVGLGDLARRDGYVERQLKRWSTQWENSKTRELASVDEVARLLGARIPQQRGTAIAHGDYRFGNCLVDCERGQIQAVLDWELCTLGDPLADVGYLGVYWARDGVDQLRSNDPSGAPGFPSYEELVHRYAERSGRAVDGIGYYVAFSSWRLAVISEGVYARYLNGAMADEVADLEQMKQGTERLADAALFALHGLG